MAEITKRKRITEKWWMEPGEAQILEEQAKLDEAYDPKRLRPGWSGKDAPAAEEMGSGYASKTDGKYDKLGSSQGEKTKKGDGQKADYPAVKEKNRKVQMIEDDLEGMGGMGGGEPDMLDDGLNPESEVPPEMEDEELEGDEAEETAQKVTVKIDGKEFELVPVEGMEGEEGMPGEEELPPEGPEGAEELGGVAAEPKDVTVQEKTRKRVREDESALSGTPAAGGDFMGEQDYDKLLDSAIAEVQHKTEKSVKEKEIRKLIQMKKYAEKKLVELFTGEYVMNRQGEPGFDFTDVTGDKEFAVIDRAASGRQYSPTISKSVWEPEEKGGKTEHAKKAEQTKKPVRNAPPQKRPVSRKEQFQAWLKHYSNPLKEDEKNPGEDSETFNKKDIILPTSISPMKPEEYPEIPEIIGMEPDVLSQYKKTQERRKMRKAVQEKAQPVKPQPIKEEVEQPEEGGPFNFKALMEGKYQNNKPLEE